MAMVLLTSVLIRVTAQDDDSPRIIVIDDKEFFLHEVEPAQGYFSIARQYNVTQKEIIEANPEIVGGLKVGQIIKVPVIKGRNKSDNNYILHSVEKGQTVSFISRKYGIEPEDIYAHNPGSEKQLINGSIIKIPVKEVQKNDDAYIHHKVQPRETLFALAQRYNVSVDDIILHNPALKAGELHIGSIVRIPKKAVSKDSDEASKSSDNVGIIEDDQYIYHEIQPGQTLYSIGRQYQVKDTRIKEMNPDVDPDDMKPGSMLRIPKNDIELSIKDEDDQNLFEYHRVRRKETLFSISRRYNIDRETIRKVNPDVDFSNLNRGVELKIPNDQWLIQNYPGHGKEDKKSSAVADESPRIATPQPSDSLCVNHEGIGHKRPMKVALLMPFALNETEQANIITKVEQGDSTKTERKEPIIADRSRVFVEFYEGVLLALDKLKKREISVELSVYDIAPNTAVLKRVLNTNPELQNVDLIIGPARSDDLAIVSDFSIKHKIKVVYPLSNVNPDMKNNPYLFHINTPDTLVFSQMTNEIIKQSEGYNLLAILPKNPEDPSVKDSYSVAFLEELRQQVFFNEFALNKDINYREYQMMGEEDQTNLEALLDPLKKNLIVVPTNQEATISKIVTTLVGICDKRNIDVSIFGMTEWLRARSIKPEDMFTLKAQIFSFYAFDYELEKTKDFIQKYRRWFYAEPHAVSSYFQKPNDSNSEGYSRYGAWGYDVANYFISAMAVHGNNFEYCPDPHDVDLVQFNFSFARISNWSGFYNQGLFLIKFMPGFQVKRVPVFSL
jgi:LysM repeat protein